METKIIDKGFRHKYFSEIPHLIDDLPISGPAHRLYCHFKRRAGESSKGACWESTEKTAKLLKMSKATVCRARKNLVAWGLIGVEKITRGGGEFPYCLVTITDIWRSNIAMYDPNGCWKADKRTAYFDALRKGDFDEGRRIIGENVRED